jgi:hypothetical protein
MSERLLTAAELHHLITLLRAENDSGEYAGNRRQYYDRTLRLIDRFQRQLEAIR